MVSKKTKITLIKKYLAPLVNQVDLDNLIIEEYGFLTTDQYEAYIKKTTWKVGRFELFCVLSLSAEAREPAVLDKEPLSKNGKIVCETIIYDKEYDVGYVDFFEYNDMLFQII